MPEHLELVDLPFSENAQGFAGGTVRSTPNTLAARTDSLTRKRLAPVTDWWQPVCKAITLAPPIWGRCSQ